jgi:hypothetical protein
MQALPLIRKVCCFFLAVPTLNAVAQNSDIKLEEKADRITVLLDGELFTEYIFKGYEKPILYPVIGPTGISMTRDFPMKKGTPNEADDHPHHKSIWFGHMKVNGESFWHTGDDAGTTEQASIKVVGNSIYTKNRLVSRNGKLIATDSRMVAFGGDESARWIDYQVTYHASETDLVFGDNKDGQMGIRMRPELRIKGPVAKGQAINANGQREDGIWGKRAPWIDYWAEIDGATVGIAVFDHPENLRHPTWWHARDYGLLSANPFGIHHFEEFDYAKAGDYRLPEGASLIFKHRFVFHEGDSETGQIEQRYRNWSRQ